MLGAAVAGQPEADDCLKVKVDEAYDAGWRFRAWQTTTLAEGAVYGTRALLLKGRPYRLLACADAAAANLDVLVYKTDGTVVARDTTRDREPVVEFTPAETGAYVVALYLREASTPDAPAAAALAIGAR